MSSNLEKCEKRNIGQEYGAVQWIGMHRGRVQEYKERHLSCQQLTGPCSSKLKGCGRNPLFFFLCLFCFFLGTASIESWDFFLNLLFAVLTVQLVSDYWSFSSINFSIYCHLKIYIYVQPTEFYWKGKIGDQIKMQRSDNGNERHNTKKIIRSIVWWSVKKMRLLLINLFLFLPKEFPHCR